jgi:hypothetical protein
MVDDVRSLLNIQMSDRRIMVDVDYVSDPRKVTLAITDIPTGEKVEADISDRPLGKLILDSSDGAIRRRT